MFTMTKSRLLDIEARESAAKALFEAVSGKLGFDLVTWESTPEATKSLYRGYVVVSMAAAEDSLKLRKRLKFTRFKNRRFGAVKPLFPVAIVWVSED